MNFLGSFSSRFSMARPRRWHGLSLVLGVLCFCSIASAQPVIDAPVPPPPSPQKPAPPAPAPEEPAAPPEAPVSKAIAEVPQAVQSLQSFSWLLDRPLDVAELLKLPQLNWVPVELVDLQSGAAHLKLPVVLKEISLEALQARGGPALLHLSNRDGFLALADLDETNALFYNAGHMKLRPRTELEKRYSGQALVFEDEQKQPLLIVKDPFYMVKLPEAGATDLEKVAFTNSGKKPLQVQIAVVSCDCTVVDDAPQTIEPGQTIELAFKFSDKSKAGETVYATVKTNDAAWPKVLLAFRVKK